MIGNPVQDHKYIFLERFPTEVDFGAFGMKHDGSRVADTSSPCVFLHPSPQTLAPIAANLAKMPLWLPQRRSRMCSIVRWSRTREKSFHDGVQWCSRHLDHEQGIFLFRGVDC